MSKKSEKAEKKLDAKKLAKELLIPRESGFRQTSEKELGKEDHPY